MAKVSYATVGFMDRDIEAALDSVAAAGFEQTEICGKEPHIDKPLKGKELSDFAKRLSSRGLTATVHAPMTTNILGAPDEQWRREKVIVLSNYLHFTAGIGAKTMTVHPVPNPEFVPDPDRPELTKIIYEATQRSLDDLVPVAKQVGVCILLENLPYYCHYPLLDMEPLRKLVDSYPADCLGLLIDTGHAGAKGIDPAEEIRFAGDRLYGTHLEDTDPKSRTDEHLIPTHGKLDWDAIRKALAEINYSGPWTFEVINGRNQETPEQLATLCRELANEWGL